MPLIPDTQLNILRILAKSPSHGYALHKEVGVATSTVYSHLNKLEEAGMVKSIDVDDSRDKKIYEITNEGERLLNLLS
jgi:DNA-binding PadR family transcriptional regulator